MSQQRLATAVAGLVEKGIDWEESLDYAGLIADLIDGQGMEEDTIATLFSAFKEAGVQQKDMSAMLGQVAAAGDIGAFGPKEMAKYLPGMLGTIKRLGMEGPEAVRFLGASLQSQFKQTQDAAAAATNMDNLLNAVISSTSQERFAKEGFDLTNSINAAMKSKKADNPVEAFIMLSEKLIAKQNPSGAKKVAALKAKIKASADGSAEEEQAMLSLIEPQGWPTSSATRVPVPVYSPRSSTAAPSKLTCPRSSPPTVGSRSSRTPPRPGRCRTPNGARPPPAWKRR